MVGVVAVATTKMRTKMRMTFLEAVCAWDEVERAAVRRQAVVLGEALWREGSLPSVGQ